MKVREAAEESETEHEFFTDVMYSFESASLQIIYGWPSPFELGELIEKWNAKLAVAYLDLLNTGMFRCPAAVLSFIKFYSRFECMEPPQVSKYGKVGDDSIDKSEGSLKEQMKNALVLVARRREDNGLFEDAAEVKMLLDGEGNGNSNSIDTVKSQGKQVIHVDVVCVCKCVLCMHFQVTHKTGMDSCL